MPASVQLWKGTGCIPLTSASSHATLTITAASMWQVVHDANGQTDGLKNQPAFVEKGSSFTTRMLMHLTLKN